MQPETPKLLEDVRVAASFSLDKTRGKVLEQFAELCSVQT